MSLLPLSGRQSSVARRAMALLMIAIAGAPIPASAEPPQRMTDDRSSAVRPSSIDAFAAQAAARFRIPERWIRVVMQAESAGNRRAVSRAGAMGLMQIMPATWAELRARHGLGNDPFDPRDNILAGAAYIRAMYDRFGAPGFLAAYNAGPERYAQHLATGRPLPRETRAYLASLSPLIDASFVSPSQGNGPPNTSDWREAPLFVGLQNRADE